MTILQLVLVWSDIVHGRPRPLIIMEHLIVSVWVYKNIQSYHTHDDITANFVLWFNTKQLHLNWRKKTVQASSVWDVKWNGRPQKLMDVSAHLEESLTLSHRKSMQKWTTKFQIPRTSMLHAMRKDGHHISPHLSINLSIMLGFKFRPPKKKGFLIYSTLKCTHIHNMHSDGHHKLKVYEDWQWIVKRTMIWIRGRMHMHFQCIPSQHWHPSKC